MRLGETEAAHGEVALRRVSQGLDAELGEQAFDALAQREIHGGLVNVELAEAEQQLDGERAGRAVVEVALEQLHE